MAARSMSPLPGHYGSAVAYFTHCLLHDEPFEGMVDLRISPDAQEILQAGMGPENG